MWQGTIDAGQLHRLLVKIAQPVRRFVLDELVHEVNEDGSGRVDFDGFLKIRHLIKKREGFALRELDGFSQVFQHFDRDDTGTMCKQEFASALTWLGFPNNLGEVHQQDGTDRRISENEFIRWILTVHNQELAQIQKVLETKANKRLRSGWVH